MPAVDETELGWQGALDDAEIRDVTALVAAAAAADGTAPVSEQTLLDLRGDRAGHLLARADGGALVGFAHLDVTDPDAGGTGELTVHPDRRRRGIGTRIVRELIERTASAGPPEGERLRLWAHGEHPGAVALAARLGFRRSRVLWQLRRSLLDPLPEPELTEGVRLRPFTVGSDESEFLRVNNAAFAWHPEQGGWDLEQVTRREAEPWFDPAGFLLAVDRQDRLLGYHWTKVHAHDDAGGRDSGPIGEVYVLGVDPSARGMRLGSALTLAGLRHLRDLALRDVLLYVEADNDAAVRVYRDLGFTRWQTDAMYAR